MSRVFDDDTANYVDLGDIAACKFETAQTWTVLCFFRRTTQTSHDVIISKWSSGPARQFYIRVASSDDVHVYMNSGKRINGATSVTTGWYLVAVTNDGTGGAGGLKLYTMDMLGAFIDDAVTGQASDDSNLTETIKFGKNNSDPHNGEIAFAACVGNEMTKEQIIEYRHNPYMVVAKQATVHFFLPLIGGSPEPDWGGADNPGTINGTLVVGSNPPIPLFNFDEWAYAVAAAGGNDGAAMYHHMRNMGVYG